MSVGLSYLYFDAQWTNRILRISLDDPTQREYIAVDGQTLGAPLHFATDGQGLQLVATLPQANAYVRIVQAGFARAGVHTGDTLPLNGVVWLSLTPTQPPAVETTIWMRCAIGSMRFTFAADSLTPEQGSVSTSAVGEIKCTFDSLAGDDQFMLPVPFTYTVSDAHPMMASGTLTHGTPKLWFGSSSVITLTPPAGSPVLTAGLDVTLTCVGSLPGSTRTDTLEFTWTGGADPTASRDVTYTAAQGQSEQVTCTWFVVSGDGSLIVPDPAAFSFSVDAPLLLVASGPLTTTTPTIAFGESSVITLTPSSAVSSLGLVAILTCVGDGQTDEIAFNWDETDASAQSATYTAAEQTETVTCTWTDLTGDDSFVKPSVTSFVFHVAAPPAASASLTLAIDAALQTQALFSFVCRFSRVKSLSAMWPVSGASSAIVSAYADPNVSNSVCAWTITGSVTDVTNSAMTIWIDIAEGESPETVMQMWRVARADAAAQA